MPSNDPWAQADAKVLTALTDRPQTAGELRVDLPDRVVRAVLHQNVRAGLAAAHRNGARTTYTITADGRRRLASVMEVA